MKKKLIRVAASPGSLAILLKGQLNFMSDHYDVKGVASKGFHHQTLRDEEGIETIEVNINRKINIWSDFVSLYKLYRLFKKEKPYIVHSITPKAGLLSMLAAFMARVPNRLHTFTGLVFPTQKGLMKKMLIFFDRIICYCATNIYPEGEGVKNDLIKYRITKKILKVIGYGNVNGIDLSYFDPELYGSVTRAALRTDLGIAESDFVLSFVGRIVYDKGIEEMINSFVQVQKDHDGVKLLLVGPYEKSMDPVPEQIEKEITNNSDIITVGWQKDVRPYFAITNLFVFPSYREGFPNVLLQAGAMGKFSIVTDINGSNEIIENGINGQIIPVKNTKALSVELVKCLKNKLLYQDMNPVYRSIIAKRYDHSFVWMSQLEEYKRLELN